VAAKEHSVPHREQMGEMPDKHLGESFGRSVAQGPAKRRKVHPDVPLSLFSRTERDGQVADLRDAIA